MYRPLLLAAALLLPHLPAAAQSPDAAEEKTSGIALGAAYTVDLSLVSDRGDRVRRLDNLDLTADGSLEPLGWSGGRFFVHLLGNSGARPNDRAGTLQGINNIEVPDAGLRLFEAWLEQDLGRGSLRVGAYDLNSEFYATESSGLLLAPAFGIGSELAATGPNGPAIFPFSALAARADVRLGKSGKVRAALVNAAARTLLDEGGLDLDFDQGLLGIAEAGIEGEAGKLMLGAWAYSRRHDRHGVDAVGRGRTRGFYLLAETPLAEGLSGFARLGLSDGRTAPFEAGWQAGLERRPAPFGSADSAIALGFHQAFLSRGERDLIASAGTPAARSEEGVELTVRERLVGPISLQPSVQWIRDPGGIAGAPSLLVGTLRLAVEL